MTSSTTVKILRKRQEWTIPVLPLFLLHIRFENTQNSGRKTHSNTLYCQVLTWESVILNNQVLFLYLFYAKKKSHMNNRSQRHWIGIDMSHLIIPIFGRTSVFLCSNILDEFFDEILLRMKKMRSFYRWRWLLEMKEIRIQWNKDKHICFIAGQTTVLSQA